MSFAPARLKRLAGALMPHEFFDRYDPPPLADAVPRSDAPPGDHHLGEGRIRAQCRVECALDVVKAQMTIETTTLGRG
jgi:hypothetical protein